MLVAHSSRALGVVDVRAGAPAERTGTRERRRQPALVAGDAPTELTGVGAQVPPREGGCHESVPGDHVQHCRQASSRRADTETAKPPPAQKPWGFNSVSEGRHGTSAHAWASHVLKSIRGPELH